MSNMSLDSSYIFSLTKELGSGQDVSDQMTSFLSDFKSSDGELLVEKPEPLARTDKEIIALGEAFLSDYAEIFWPPHGTSKDQKLRWSTDKEKITDLVRTVFTEKHRLYISQRNKDLNVDTKGNTPQPPPQKNGTLETKETTQPSEPTKETETNPTADDADSLIEEPTSEMPTKQESSNANEQEDGSIHLASRTRRDRSSAAISAEPANNNFKASPVVSPLGGDVTDSNKPHKFASEDDYRAGIVEALERAKVKGNTSVVGAIQYVRTTLNDTHVRDAISNSSSSKKIGSVRLTQINERTMAWVFEKLDGTCLWVKPYKGKVMNGVVRYAGWTGEDNVFTDFPVTYGILSREGDGPRAKDSPSTAQKRSMHRSSTGGSTTSKIVNLKLRRNTEGAVTSPAVEKSDLPAYIHGDSWTMERAKAAVKHGHPVDPPCKFCVEAGYQCMKADRGRTCGYCIVTLRSAGECESSRSGVDAMDYEPDSAKQLEESPGPIRPLLTHSGRVSKKPTRSDYIDRSENDSDSALSSVSLEEPVRGPGPSKLRRKFSAIRSTPSTLKRPRPASLTMENEYATPPAHTPAAGPATATATGLKSASALVTSAKSAAPDVWFSFTPAHADGSAKQVSGKEVDSVNAFFDAALKAWRLLGGKGEPAFDGLEVSWPERKMIVEWRDQRDWERMMTMIGRAAQDEHGEVEITVKYKTSG